MLVSFSFSASAVGEASTTSESFNEYDYIQIIKESTPQELATLGVSEQEATEIISSFEDALSARASLSETELRGYGYDESEIALLHAYANGETLSPSQLRDLGSNCEGTITLNNVSANSASFSYTFTWDRCPIQTLSDSAAMRWIAYDADDHEIGVEQDPFSMTVGYYYVDKTSADPSSTLVFLYPGTNEPNLDFNTLNMQFPVHKTHTGSSGIISDCYAKTGTVNVTISTPSGIDQAIHHIFVGGLYGHTIWGVGSPSVNVGQGTINISFTGNTSIDPIASKRGTIYRASSTIEYW